MGLLWLLSLRPAFMYSVSVRLGLLTLNRGSKVGEQGVPCAEQEAAVAFLHEPAFETPSCLHDDALLRPIVTEEFDSPFASFLGTTVDVSQSDIRAFVRGQLGDLRGEADRAARRTRDAATRYHLQDVVVRIDAMLETDA